MNLDLNVINLPSFINDGNTVINYLKLGLLQADLVLNHLLTIPANFTTLNIYNTICKQKYNQYLFDGFHFLTKSCEIQYAKIYLIYNDSLDLPISEKSEYTLKSRYSLIDEVKLPEHFQNMISIMTEDSPLFSEYNYRLFAIRAHNKHLIEYYSKNKISQKEIEEIVINDWILAMNKLKIPLKLILQRCSYLSRWYNDYFLKLKPLYWEIIKARVDKLLDTRIDSLTLNDANKLRNYGEKLTNYNNEKLSKVDIELAIHLFSQFSESYNDKEIKELLLNSLPYPILCYLLGYPIHHHYPANVNDRLKELLELGPDQYYLGLIERNKKKLKKIDSQIVNRSDTLYNNIYEYSMSDILLDYTYVNEKLFIYAFSRSEFNTLLNQKQNYYTRVLISPQLKANIEMRLSLSKALNLPDCLPLRQLYDELIIYRSNTHNNNVNEMVVKNRPLKDINNLNTPLTTSGSILRDYMTRSPSPNVFIGIPLFSIADNS